MKMMLHAAAAAIAIAIPQVSGGTAGRAQAQSPAPAQNLDPAAAFGARESVQSIALSPDGRRIAFVEPAVGQGSILYTVDLAAGTEPRRVTAADGTDQRLGGCEFVSNQRLVCTVWGVGSYNGLLVPVSRLVALDADGSNLVVLGESDSFYQRYVRTFTGNVIDWLPGTDGAMLMSHSFIPEQRQATRLERRQEGFGVVRMDTRTNRFTIAEAPRRDAVRYIADGRGTVRIIATRGTRGSTGQDSPVVNYQYRPAESREWRDFGTYDEREESGFLPVAVDPELNSAYAFGPHDGRTALFRVKLDGSMQREVVASHDQVDVDGLIRIGRRNRVVGASFATDRRQVIYFDPELRSLADRFHRALPNLPLIQFVDASEDEQRLLIWAGSDIDPGRYYIYDKGTRQLNEIMLSRPELENVTLAEVRPITYRAADGTQIPAYLTLPPGSSGRGLPAIVMPHGGPSSRDEWGFDWLAQFLANRGYAVLQPNYRGSAGYGDAWLARNGFQGWRTSIGDITAGARWLAAQGIADPGRMGILGWSYGGYAALQAGVTEPGLFRAIVAIAPVTDLQQAKDDFRDYTNARNASEFIGSGPHIREGSPLQNVQAITAPVLLFHGDRDLNVSIIHSRRMDSALRGAGKASELVAFPGLEHDLADSAARVQMLQRIGTFLQTNLTPRP